MVLEKIQEGEEVRYKVSNYNWYQTWIVVVYFICPPHFPLATFQLLCALGITVGN